MKITKVQGLPSNLYDTRDFANPRILNLTLRLSNNCNFNCHYCSYYDNSFKPISIENLEKFLAKLIQMVKETNKYDKINWYIHGGEPTIYPDFIQAMLTIHDFQNYYNLDYEIEVQTNASYKKLEKLLPLKYINISFICSYQNHQNTPSQYKKFVSFVLEHNMMAGTDLILENFGTINEVENIKDIFSWLNTKRKEYNHFFNIQTNTVDGVSLNSINPKYKEFALNKKFSELLEITYEDGTAEAVDYDTFTSEGKNKFKLFKCNVGQNNLIIDTTIRDNIKIYKCFSDILYQKNKPDYKFEFKTTSLDKDIQNIKKLLKPVICIHPKCICEIQIPKSRRVKNDI